MPVLFLLLMATFGCGGVHFPGSKLRLPVSGTVKLNDQLVSYALIEFIPSSADKGIAGSVVVEEGRFDLPSEKGLEPGEYDVTVLGYMPEDTQSVDEKKLKEMKKARSIIPEFYQHRGHLKILIDEGQSTDLVLELSSKPSQGS
ncbi:MAG TPA: hypothetical protein VNQ76_08635 [Planctomicrobium sp.]|nr:hypothetical protein [Planctomicrobium sp.]